MMSKRNPHGDHGQSLVELVVVLGVLSLLSTGLIAGMTASLKSAQFSTQKSSAIKYAQEGIEYARTLRDRGWSTFYSYKDEPHGLWCLSKAGAWTSASGTINACNNNIDALFTRSVAFVWNDPQMSVTTVVSWVDGGGTHTTQLVTYFTNWR